MTGKLIRNVLLIVSAILLAYGLFSSRPAAAAADAASTPTRRPNSTLLPSRTATPTILPSATPTITPTPTFTPSRTATPTGPFAWPDTEQDWQNFSPLAAIVLHFNAPMSTTIPGNEPALLTLPWIDGTFTWSEDGTRLAFQPDSPLAGGQIYHIYTHPNLRTAAGAALNGVNGWALIAAYGPRLIGHSPTGALNTRQLDTSLRFDRPMDADSVAAALSVQPSLPLTLTWQENTLLISSTQVLTPGLQLAFSLAGAATDLEGVPLGEAYTWQAVTRPFTATVIPIDAANNILQIAIKFNYAVDPASIEAALNFSPAMTGTITWKNQNELSFEPNEWHAAWSLHDVVFTDTLRDLQGNVLPGLGPMKFIPPVPVKPNDHAELFFWIKKPTDALEITFRAPVDEASAEAAIRIEPEIDGVFSWNKHTLSFQPTQPWPPGAYYTITISPTARTVYGQPFLLAPCVIKFRTPLINQSINFGEWGANLQVVDAGGSRAIQFRNVKSEAVELSLYQFELSSFMEKYRSSYSVYHRDYDNFSAISLDGGELAASWSWKAEEMDERAAVPELYLPADLAPGLYVLNMTGTDGVLFGQLFVVLTNNNLVVKSAGEELLAWVSNQDGVNLPDIEVRLYSEKGEQIRTGNTDTDGVYRTTIPAGYQPMLVVARTAENDFTISGIEGIWGDYSYIRWPGAGPDPITQAYRAHAYTNRIIYHPGEVVYFKAIVRADQDAKYTLLPAGTPVTMRVRDARDNIVQTFELTTNEFGSVNAEFQLVEGAMPGDYTIETIIEGIAFRQGFKVQNDRQTAFRTHIATDATRYIAGDPFTITVQADNLLGEPLAHANVTVRQYRMGMPFCGWQDDCPEGWMWYQDKAEIRHRGVTDANGQAIISGIAEYDNDDYYSLRWIDDQAAGYSNADWHVWGLEVTVQDGDQTVSQYTLIEVSNVAGKIKLDIGAGVKPSGKPFSITASSTAIDGEPISGTLLTLNVYQWDGETRDYDSSVITPTQLTTGADGFAKTNITLPHNGYYKLLLQGIDSRGTPIVYSDYLYAYSPANTWATQHTRGHLAISADQTEVRPYDTVQVMIESTFAGPAMLTFERGRVNRVKPIMLTPPLTVVDVEIIPEDAPNIFITVNAWQPVDFYGHDEVEEYLSYQTTRTDAVLHHASVELKVENSDKELNVAITSDRPTYTPHETAMFTMTVTNAQGQPVEAELSLSLLKEDEAISIQNVELRAPIFERFYGRRRHTVYTYHSMAPYRILEVPYADWGGDDFGISPSFDFPDTAIWLPALTTDKNGVVTATLDLPDNLTTWRVVVRAVTKSTLVGEATYNVTTQQAVAVRPQLPRTLTVGDTVTLSAFIHNYSDTPLELFTSLQADSAGLEISGTVLLPVTLAANEVKLVSWQAKALAPGEPHVTVAAFQAPRLENGRVAWTVGDAVELPLAIQPLAAAEFFAEAGTFTQDYTATIVLPPSALAQSTLTLSLSRSPAGSLLEGLEYLTGYPYGCVEQTMSRALPNAVVGRAFEKLAAGETARREALEPLIRASVQRLYGYQHNDGGWGWWYDDASHDYQTAWVVFGLSVTAEAGYEVDPQVIQLGVQWLQAHLDEMDIRTRAYALYSMAVAGHGDLAATASLYTTALLELDPFSQAALALAYHELGRDESAEAILQTLAASASQKNGQVFWKQPSQDGYYEAKTMASTTRSTALVLDVLIRIDPQNPLIPGAVAWLMDQRRPHGWGTTNETAYTILAITDHLQAVQENLGPAELQIEVNGHLLLTATVAVQMPQMGIQIPFEQLQAGLNQLRVKQVAGEGNVYYRLAQNVYLPESEIPAAGMITVQRQYLNPKTKQPVNHVQIGELVLVRLQVSLPQDGFYIIVEDHLPGGLEALNEKLNNTSHELAFNTERYAYDEIFFWQDYGYNYKEIYAGRVSFFVTEMSAGQYEFTYLARATRPGNFSTPPVEVYAMYDENLWGRSASGKINVLPE